MEIIKTMDRFGGCTLDNTCSHILMGSIFSKIGDNNSYQQFIKI